MSYFWTLILLLTAMCKQPVVKKLVEHPAS